MGVFYETIPKSMIEWILQQKMFCVATAPLSASGHVNVSPKGGPYFGVPDEKTFWYMDLTGSGNETISHLHEPGNGRVTIMFNGFEGPPRIIRLWGLGRVIENGSNEFTDFVTSNKISTIPGTRSIIVVDIHQVGSSCGFSVPFYDFKDFRPVLNDHFAKKEARFKAGKTEESMDRYWAYKNAWSMDGLPGMKRGLEAGKREGVAPIKKMVGPLAPKQYRGRSTAYYRPEHVLIIAMLCLILGAITALYGPLVADHILAAIPKDMKMLIGQASSMAR